MQFSSQAERLWIDYQQDNRQRKLEADTLNDAECSRLASEPMQTLSIAMIFQACVCAKQRSPLSSISSEVLSCAIHHMTHNLESARYLDSIADRESVRGSAEILLAKIRKDLKDRARDGTILLTRSDITARYAPHSARQGAWTPNDIFLKFLTGLIRQGETKLYEKNGETEKSFATSRFSFATSTPKKGKRILGDSSLILFNADYENVSLHRWACRRPALGTHA